MKARLDDTWYFIEFEDEEFKCSSRFEFTDAVNILLSKSQRLKLIADEGSKFNISKKRYDNFVKFMNGENNIWKKNKAK